jgi:chitinase
MGYWHFVKGFPREKLLLGIPCYGRSFLAPAWYAPVTGPSPREYVPYRAVRELQAEGWRRVWDAEAGVPYLAKDGAGELISYEDPESAEAKGRWARAQGFRGIFFWEITQDWTERGHELVAAARRGFLPGSDEVGSR